MCDLSFACDGKWEKVSPVGEKSLDVNWREVQKIQQVAEFGGELQSIESQCHSKRLVMLFCNKDLKWRN